MMGLHALGATAATVTTPLVVGVSALVGLVVGSFLNVVIWRVPRNESVVRPRSHCPGCGSMIDPRDNVPVVSWLALRGRCRHCRAPIPVRYPMVEAGCSLLFGLVAWRYGDSWALPAFLVLAGGLLALSVIDAEHFVIPNRIVYPMALLALPLLAAAAAAEGEWWWFVRALIGGAGAFGVMYLIWFVAPRAMGFGDVRLAFVLGLFLGWLGPWYVVIGLFFGFLYGAVVGVALMVVGRHERRQAIPFGPFLAAGAMTMVLFGAPIVAWYQAAGGV